MPHKYKVKIEYEIESYAKEAPSIEELYKAIRSKETGFGKQSAFWWLVLESLKVEVK